ncbi:hypothetical protein JCM10207_008252 [Rhodosporidiobolus poonsookiae]
MSVPVSPPDPPTPVVLPPTPSSSAPPRVQAPAGGEELRPAQAPPPPSPPRQTPQDQGAVLAEVLGQALSMSEGQGGAVERRLEEREQAAAVARKPPVSSRHSSGAVSVGSASSHLQRPSPSSGRGSFTTYSSRSPNSRTSSGSNPYDHPSSRSSLERRPSHFPQSHLYIPTFPTHGMPSPYTWSPSQHTPSASSDAQYSLSAFYPSPSFYQPSNLSPYHASSDSSSPGHAIYSQQYSSPAFAGGPSFTSPITSPHDYGQPYGAGFPFTAPPVSSSLGYPAYIPQSQPAGPYGGVPPPCSGEGDYVYDDSGDQLSSQEVAQIAAAQAQAVGYAQAPMATALPAYPFSSYQPPPSQPAQAPVSGPYQPVYFAQPVPGPPLTTPASTAPYPPPLPAVAPPSQSAVDPSQPLQYPISSATAHAPASTHPHESASVAPYPEYPIRGSGIAQPVSLPLPQPMVEAAPPPPPPPGMDPALYGYPPLHAQQYIPPPPPPPGPYPFPHPSGATGYPGPAPSHAQGYAPHPPPPGSLVASHSRHSSAASIPMSHSHSHSRSSSSAAGPPRIYEAPATPARGHLAQAGLRQAAAAQGVSPERMAQVAMGGGAGSPGVGPAVGVGVAGRAPRPVFARKDLPKPPTHSPHALWVGNVPSDASHAELWQFFQTRPTPAASGYVAGLGDEGLDLGITGIESIHLITRSNCAFVNYISHLHLRHAITVSNGASLRPEDRQCKHFVCRERKLEDDAKSGVGAQRVGGIHKTYIREQQARMAEGQQRVVAAQQYAEAQERAKGGAALALGEGAGKVEGGAEPQGRRQSVMSVGSQGTSSTTSSFLSKHFERRYFILKSHDEADLRLSVETGLWATQSHNEPVLQQAFRTAKTVYLIFGANGQGCWFGYAKMSGPISTATSTSTSSGGSRPSWSSRTEGTATYSSSGGGVAGAPSLSSVSQTILEEGEASSFPTRPPVYFTESESRHPTASPSPLGQSPASPPTHLSVHAGSAPATLAPSSARVSTAAQQAMTIEQDLVARETADNLQIPLEVATVAARRAASMDDRALQRSSAVTSRAEVRTPAGASDAGTLQESAELVTAELGERRREVLESEAERRNRKLEEVVDRTEEEGARLPPVMAAASSPTTPHPRLGSAQAWGTPFSVEWVKVQRLPFINTRAIRNSFNGNREVKISRDGTEVEPGAGEALLSAFWAADSPSSPPSPSRTYSAGFPHLVPPVQPTSAPTPPSKRPSVSPPVRRPPSPAPPTAAERRASREEKVAAGEPGQAASGMVAAAVESGEVERL